MSHVTLPGVKITSSRTAQAIIGLSLLSPAVAMADELSTKAVAKIVDKDTHAFYVGDGLWVTVLHAVNDNKAQHRIRLPGVPEPGSSNERTCSVRAIDHERDLAVLDCDGKDKNPEPLALQRTPSIENQWIPHRIYTISQTKVSAKIVSSPTFDEKPDFGGCVAQREVFYVPDALADGRSGAPIVNLLPSGVSEVVGILTHRSVDTPPNSQKKEKGRSPFHPAAFGIAAEQILRLLDKARAKSDNLPRVATPAELFKGADCDSYVKTMSGLPSQTNECARYLINGEGEYVKACENARIDMRTYSPVGLFTLAQSLVNAQAGPAAPLVIVDGLLGAQWLGTDTIYIRSGWIKAFANEVRGKYAFASAPESTVLKGLFKDISGRIPSDPLFAQEIAGILQDLNDYKEHKNTKIVQYRIKDLPASLLCSFSAAAFALGWSTSLNVHSTDQAYKFCQAAQPQLKWALLVDEALEILDASGCKPGGYSSEVSILEYVRRPRFQVAMWIALHHHGILDLDEISARIIAGDSQKIGTSGINELYAFLQELRRLAHEFPPPKAYFELQRFLPAHSQTGYSVKSLLHHNICRISEMLPYSGLAPGYFKALDEMSVLACQKIRHLETSIASKDSPMVLPELCHAAWVVEYTGN